jgi:nucleoside 2-deoxyribosyltransferase
MSAPARPVWLIGDAIVDVTLASGSNPAKLRFGGVMHAARALYGADVGYAIAYVAPGYARAQFERFAAAHGALECVCVGAVVGCPNVLVIPEATEAGEQGYEFLLRDEREVIPDPNALGSALAGAGDVVVLADATSWRAIAPLLAAASVLHVDADVAPAALAGELGRPFDTYMLSTSAQTFRSELDGSVERLRDAAADARCARVLFKENRGGARLLSTEGDVSVPAFVRPIAHSVGVGDAFDALYVALRGEFGERGAMAYASALAADYAASTDPEVFIPAMRQTLGIPVEDMIALAGVRVPWEERAGIGVYVAAPDFDWVDRQPIDDLARALRYHGFTPRLPVREVGQLPVDPGRSERIRVLNADLEILDQCQLVVGVLLFDDPGTLVEIGLAVERGMPVLVYDPHGLARNPFIRDLPSTVSSSLEEVIVGVFEQVSSRR